MAKARLSTDTPRESQFLRTNPIATKSGTPNWEKVLLKSILTDFYSFLIYSWGLLPEKEIIVASISKAQTRREMKENNQPDTWPINQYYLLHEFCL